MARLVLILDRRTEDALLSDIIEHGHTVVARLESAREFTDQVGRIQADAVITTASHSGLGRELLAACDAGGIRVIALAGSPSERRHAAEVGLVDVVDSGARWDELEGLLIVRAAAPMAIDTRADADGDAPRVIAVWGPTGAPGRTSVAIGIAAELAASGVDVILADADSYGGTIAPALGLVDESPGFAAACRLAAADALTADELARIAQPYRSRGGGFRVLTGISRASRWPELGASRVSAVVSACRRDCEVLVIDTGFCLETDEEISSDLFAPHRNGATIAALRAADHVVAVGASDPVGLPRFLRAYGDLVELLEAPRMSVVINRVRGGAVGIGASGQLRATLRRFGGIDDACLIPDDQRAHDAAMLSARTLRDEAPRSKARQAMARFVEDELRYAGARVDAQ